LNSSDEVVEQMIKDKNKNNFNVNMIANNLMQIYFVNKLSKVLGIDKFNPDMNILKRKLGDIIEKEDGIKYMKEYKKLFTSTSTKSDIKTWEDLYKIFVKSINMLCGKILTISTDKKYIITNNVKKRARCISEVIKYKNILQNHNDE